MLFGLTVVPLGNAESMGDPVSQVVQEIQDAGLAYRLNAMSTVIEGEWDEVMPVIRAAEEKVRATAGRVFLVITVDDDEGAVESLQRSITDVERRLGHSVMH